MPATMPAVIHDIWRLIAPNAPISAGSTIDRAGRRWPALQLPQPGYLDRARQISRGYQTVAIRKASTTTASISAMQTTSKGAVSRLPADSDAFLAATEAASGLRIFTPS